MRVSLVKEKSSVTIKMDGKPIKAFTLNGKNPSKELTDQDFLHVRNNINTFVTAGILTLEGGNEEGVKGKGSKKKGSGKKVDDTPPEDVEDDEEDEDEEGDEEEDDECQHLAILDLSIVKMGKALEKLLKDKKLTREDILALRKAEEDGNTRKGVMDLLDEAMNEISE